MKKRGHKVRKTKGAKKNLVFFLLILMSLILIPLGRRLLVISNKWDYIKIKHINIKGNNRISIEQIKTWAGIEEGLNILSLDLDRITSLAQAQPWIRSLSVERRFPDSLSIRVEESFPVAVWEDEGKQYSMDEFGILLEECTAFPELPFLTGCKTGLSQVGKRCPSPYWPEALCVIESVRTVFPELMEDIIEFHILSENQMVIFLKGDRKILLNTADANLKLRLLKALINKAPAHWQSMVYCDMRFKDKIIFG